MTNQEKSSFVFLSLFVLQCTLICLFTYIVSNLNSAIEPFVPVVDILSIVTLGFIKKDKFTELIQGISDNG